MNHAQQKTLRKIDEAIAKAYRKGDLIGMVRLQQDRERLAVEYAEEQRMSLKAAMEGYTREEKDEATAMIVYCIATADLLYGATLDIESKFRKRFGLDALPMLGKMRDIVEELRKIVKTIDDVKRPIFSEKYADMVDAIETKYEATMKNFIYREVMKDALRKPTEGRAAPPSASITK